MSNPDLLATFYGEGTNGMNAAADTIRKVIADVPTPAQVKAIAYTVDRYPDMVKHGDAAALDWAREDYRAGYVQGLEAAVQAILAADETGHSLLEIRALLDAEI